MNADYSITANFAINQHDLTVGSSVGGSVTDPGEDTFTYDHGTEVDLVAEADADYHFVEWTGDTGTIADTTSATTTITMEGDYSIQANFAEDEPVDLPDVTGIWVEESGDDIVVNWDDVEAQEYNVYHSADQYADFATWTEVSDEVVVDTNTFTHDNALGGANFYYVTSSDGEGGEGEMSDIAYCVQRSFADDEDRTLHYISVPAVLGDLEEVWASDLVLDIEGSLDTADNINRVVRWDYTVGGYEDDQFYYVGAPFNDWSGGEDFLIQPGDGIGIFVSENADFDWHICGRDIEFSRNFADDEDRTLHYISVPFTLFDYTEDGELWASDLVLAMEGSLDTANNINRVVRWDYTVGGYEDDQFYYVGAPFNDWSGGEDFLIQPGDGIGIFVSENADFLWEVELVTTEME